MRLLAYLRPVRATVIIPTFGEARFARWAVESVRRQTVENMEICVSCDGSPPAMVSLFKDMAAEDSRIRVFSFPKSERAGEPYRDLIVRKETRGRNIYYCAHDDLWFPDHVEVLEELLRHKCFGHSLHACVGPEAVESRGTAFPTGFMYADLEEPRFRETMLNDAARKNLFGLTFGAHTRKAYRRLKEGWTTTPDGIWTDLYMWRKFLEKFPEACGTCKKVTALCFPLYAERSWSEQERKNGRTCYFTRNGWPEQQREDELAFYFQKMQEPGFLNRVNDLARRSLPELRLAPQVAASTASRGRCHEAGP